MAGTTWPALVPGQKAKATEVESKFDWLEGSIAPMNAGSMTTDVFDLGTTTARWNNVYVKNVVASKLTLISGSTTILDMTTTGIVSWPNQSLVRAYNDSGSSAIFSSTAVIAQLRNESFDLQDEYTTASNPYFSPKVAGRYRVAALFHFFRSGVDSTARMQLIVNSTTVSVAQCDMITTQTNSCFHSDIVTLSPGDRVYYGAFAGAAGAGLIYGTQSSFMTVQKVT